MHFNSGKYSINLRVEHATAQNAAKSYTKRKMALI